jgi:hypothetical protein
MVLAGSTKHKMKEMATNQEEKECKLKKRQKRFIRP